MFVGKLSGLHIGDGHVMWTLTYPEHQAPQQIFPWRSFHDLQRAPELLTLHSAAASSSYSVVNAHSGKALGSGKLAFLLFRYGICSLLSNGTD